MKGTCIVLGLVLAGVQMSASGADTASPVNSTKDIITGLPVYPGVTNPNPLPTTVLCKSQSSGNFFIVSGKNAREVANWYTAALPGFKRFSTVTGGTSQDTYFSPDGTQEVTLTGRPNSAEVYSISYRRFHPGLSTSAMASFNTGKMICGRT